MLLGHPIKHCQEPNLYLVRIYKAFNIITFFKKPSIIFCYRYVEHEQMDKTNDVERLYDKEGNYERQRLIRKTFFNY